MAEGPDRESRTHEPTEKKLADETEKGNVPHARELVTFGSLLSILAVLALMGSWSGLETMNYLRAMLDGAGTITLADREDAALVLINLIVPLAISLLAVLSGLAIGPIIASLIQNQPQLAAERIRPKLQRISLSSGWHRLFGLPGLVEFLKSVIKLVALATVVLVLLMSELPDFVLAIGSDPSLLPENMRQLTMRIVMPMAVVASVLALADFAWSRFKWRRDLRMTHEELKEEMKQAEGDPHLKAKIRSIARQRASRRMLAKLPSATMVVANPTHYAVALRYHRGDKGAPMVVAKGLDYLALKIREVAESRSIPVVENKPLARALYEKAELDQEIPAEFYRAVAELIHYLHLRGKYRTAPSAR